MSSFSSDTQLLVRKDFCKMKTLLFIFKKKKLQKSTYAVCIIINNRKASHASDYIKRLTYMHFVSDG